MNSKTSPRQAQGSQGKVDA